MSVNVTGTPGTLTVLSSIQQVNGPSGIVVDNSASTTTGNFPQPVEPLFLATGEQHSRRSMWLSRNGGRRLRDQGDASGSELSNPVPLLG
jgi:hypothetical protein